MNPRVGNCWQSDRFARVGATLGMLLLLAACGYWLALMGGTSEKLARVIPSKEYMAPGTRYLLWKTAGILHCIYPVVGILIIWTARRWERWLLLVLAVLVIHLMVSGFMCTAGAAALVPRTLQL